MGGGGVDKAETNWWRWGGGGNPRADEGGEEGFGAKVLFSADS